MTPMLNIAIRAARQAGDIIAKAVERLDIIKLTQKQGSDFVTNVDIQAEQAIVSTLRKAFPSHSILAEESGHIDGDDEYQWIIDPLDGTTNFIHGFPHFSVSIALKHKNKLEVGVVYDPLREELFTAVRGKGAQMNNRKIRVSSQKQLEFALLGTGFPFKDFTQLSAYLATFGALLPLSGGVRRAGSAALDLAYVAAARLDGFWEFHLSPWDIAAGTLLVREAGGLVGDFQGTDDFLQTGNIVAGNPKLFKAILQALQPVLK